MRNLRWICWYLWEGLPTLLAFPIDSSKTRGTDDFWSSQWENHWLHYGIGSLGFVIVAFTLAGCLCCRRQRRPKGFQDDAGNGKEFKDGSTAGTETTIERVPSASLELEVPRIQTTPSNNKIPHKEISSSLPDTRITIKPPSSSLFFDDAETANNFTRSLQQPCSDWFEAAHFPREKLKYLREIGRGWFGTVVEGTTELDAGVSKNTAKNRGVVVRILTEEATSSEKSWFLGESTPYLKLRHSNILELLGSCLETDPYLLLFESCPAGDLKNFLLTNRENADALRRENLPTRLAINIADALEHMHDNGFAHTDLSARNCLVAPDLTAKLGDYGTGVEKYPGDYYVVGDRALPIRWSAPESLECTDTTIETRSITPRANLWTYGVLLWEIATWAERPYDDLGDEQVIESIFSRKSDFTNNQNSRKLLKKLLEKYTLPTNFRDSLVASWNFLPTERATLRETREALCGKRIEDFESRWENLRPNGTSSVDKSASLRDLRGSVDSERWQASTCEEKKSVANFRLGPEEPVKNCPRENSCLQESGSETEEESWRGRVERGAYTEKVKQKSKSVADLMVLVHIDSDSDGEISLGPQTTEKTAKKRLPASGSDGDLRSAVIADEFDEALRKLREPASCYWASMKIGGNIGENVEIGENSEENVKISVNLAGIRKNDGKEIDDSTNIGKNVKIGVNEEGNEKIVVHLADIGENMMGNAKISENNEKRVEIGKNVAGNVKIGDTQKLLTLTHQGQKSILRLSFGTSGEPTSDLENEKLQQSVELPSENRHEESVLEKPAKNPAALSRSDSHVLRLVSKGDPNLPLLRYVPERTSTPENLPENPSFDSFLVLESCDAILSSSNIVKNSVDVQSWNDALAHELEKKNPAYVGTSMIFDETPERKTIFADSEFTAIGKKDFNVKRSKSAPNTPKSLQNQSAGEKIGKGFSKASSSAPETPRKNDLVSSIETIEDSRKMEKNVNYYRDDEDIVTGSSSAPETPFQDNYGMENVDEDSSVCEELEPGMMKRTSNEADDEEDRKHLSTPDDERSSDSGFRDKESCEEEESPIPGPQVSSIILGNSSSIAGNLSPLSASAEEEQMRILFELDTILDAEYYGNYRDKNDDVEISLDDAEIGFTDRDEIAEKMRSISESLESTESTEIPDTVRANSCEPNFLDNFLDKREDDTKFDIFKNVENFGELPENTEADSVSEFSKFEENRLSSKKEDVLADSSSESPLEIDKHSNTDSPLKTDKHSSTDSPLKTDKYLNTDSSSELARLNFDSSSSREKTTSNETTDFSPELRSDFEKNLSNSDSSPLKTDHNSSTDFSIDLRFNATSDTISSVDKGDSKDFATPDSAEIREGNSPRLVGKTDRMGPRTENMEKSHSSVGKADNINFSLSENSEIFEENLSSSTDKTDLANSRRIENFEISEAKLSSPAGKQDRNHFQETRSHSAGKEGRKVVSMSECSEIWDEYSLASAGKADPDILPVGENSENFEEILSIESPVKIDHQTSDFSVDIQRENSDVEQWSSRENVNENDDEDSSTISLRSDNSYVSFGLDEEFVAAIRNELREKLPRAQMPVIEALDPHDEKESTSINPETKNWDDDEIDENSERTSVDISIRYNIYGTPLSPIMEERESAGTSESLISKEDSGDASIASRVSALSEDVLVVDTRTNHAMIVEAGANGGNVEILNSHHEDDRDTSHGDFSDEENLEYPQNNLTRGLENKRISMGSGGAPLPSPEEESKWQQQFPLPLQMQDDLMSTSFGTDRDWDSQDDEEGEDEADDGDEDEEENSSSSGEFVWKRYDESHGDLENVATRSPPNKPKSQEPEIDLDEDEDDGEEDEDEEGEEEFTPSAWDATLAPHRSALRSPEKNLKSGDQKKSVWFKKQRYHCVYEYPKETPVVEGQGPAAATWEPTSYADWEEMMDEPRLDVYPMEYNETNRAGDEEFYVSSSNRPFQFQSGEGKYVSQFFPGASSTLLQHESQQQQQISSSSSSSSREVEDLQTSQDEVDRVDSNPLAVQSSRFNGNSRGMEVIENQQTQLGELRHTRDRLKLNLLSTSGSAKIDEDVGNVEKIEEIDEGTEENARKMKETAEKMEEIGAKKGENDEKSEEKVGKVEENDENIEEAVIIEENAAKVVENSGKIEQNVIKPESGRKMEENIGKLEDDRGKMEESSNNVGNARKIAENSSKIEENVGETVEYTGKIFPTEEPSSISEKSCNQEGTAELLKKDDLNIDKIDESSNPKNLDNLAVKESPKMENNEGKSPDNILSVEKSTNIVDRDIEREKSIIDNAREETEKSSRIDRSSLIRDNDENIEESISRSRENSETNGDQNSSRSEIKNDKRENFLDIPRLENDENLSSNDESAKGAIVELQTTTTNNSSKKVENIDDDKTKNVGSLSKS